MSQNGVKEQSGQSLSDDAPNEIIGGGIGDFDGAEIAWLEKAFRAMRKWALEVEFNDIDDAVDFRGESFMASF